MIIYWRVGTCAISLYGVTMPTRAGWEKSPEMHFRTLADIEHLSFEQKEDLLQKIDFILSECEISKKNILDDCKYEEVEPDPDWLKRVNYKINIKRAQKRNLQNHLRKERGESLIGSFHDVAKIMLPEESYEKIMRKAKELNEKTIYGAL
jgi:hypothetical protein